MSKGLTVVRAGAAAGLVAFTLSGIAGSAHASIQSGNIDLATDTDILRIDGAFSSTDPYPGGAGYSVADAGDVNGDSIGDLIIGAPNTNHPRSVEDKVVELQDLPSTPITNTGQSGNGSGLSRVHGGPKSGSSYVVFGGSSLPPKIDLLNLADVGRLGGVPGFRIDGAYAYDLSGHSVEGAGDINNDGLDDLIVGAPGAGYNDRSDSGSAYIVFGKDGDTDPVDLAEIGGSGNSKGFRIDGTETSSWTGYSVAGVGDVGGDRCADVIVGAPWESSLGGSAYVVFGDCSSNPSSPSNVDLASLGSRGFRINKPGYIGSGDMVGWSVAGAGDINADGKADVVVGSSNDNNNGRLRSGTAYVIFGISSPSPADVDLTRLNDRGFRIDGAKGRRTAPDAPECDRQPTDPPRPIPDYCNNGDKAGNAVAAAGDVNGDGVADVIVGAPRVDVVDPDNNVVLEENIGAAYVIFGSHFPTDVDLASLNSSDGLRIFGDKPGGQVGFSVGGTGDIDGDGRDDVIVGAPWSGSASQGSAYVVYGKPSTDAIDLASLGTDDGFSIKGAVGQDTAGRSVAGAGDVNGDGALDVILGAPFADNNARTDSGSAYVIYGEPIESPKTPGSSPFIAGQPASCAKVLYENRLRVPREIRLSDLIKGKGVKVYASASEASSGYVKIEINGREARQFKIYRKTSKIKRKLFVRTNVEVGTEPKAVYLKAKGKEARLIRKALRLKRAPKRTKLKLSLDTHAVAKRSLERLNTQTIRALRRGKVKRTDTYRKIRQVLDKTGCGQPLKASIKGPRETKLTVLTSKKAKRGRGTKVTVECSEDCTARIGYRLWGRYEIGLKFRKKGQKMNRLLFERKVKLKGGKPQTLKLGGVVSKKLRKLLVRGAKKKRYDRIKMKYVIEGRSSDNRSAAGSGTSRVLLRFK